VLNLASYQLTVGEEEFIDVVQRFLTCSLFLSSQTQLVSFNVVIHGSPADWFYSMMTAILKGQIEKTLLNTLSSTIRTQYDALVNHYLQTTPTSYSFGNNFLLLNYPILLPPVVNSSANGGVSITKPLRFWELIALQESCQSYPPQMPLLFNASKHFTFNIR
jgi:hypothetical protein